MSSPVSLFLILLATLINVPFIISSTPSQAKTPNALRRCGIRAMYNFGDSVTDTGNVLVEFPGCYQGRFPYGMTIHRATGRFSDGYLFLDRIAEAAGLPHLNPSLNKHLDHTKGANFAVGGVGVLSKKLRAKWNVTLPRSNSSLDVQFRWLEELVGQQNFKDGKARRKHLRSSLFLVGGGTNDYLFMGGGSYSSLPVVKQKIAMMPDIMAAINSYLKKLIVSYGATKVVVFGIYKSGSDEQNQFYALHNQRLQEELQKLREEFPRVRLVYGDVWGAVQFLLDHYTRLGYKHPTGDICCGSWTEPCASSPTVPYCRDPNEYWLWDGQHLTSYTHRLISGRIIPQISAAMGCAS